MSNQRNPNSGLPEGGTRSASRADDHGTVSRRACLRTGLATLSGLAMAGLGTWNSSPAIAAQQDARKRRDAVTKGLDWLATTQSRLGHWSADGSSYRAAMTALAGIAFSCQGTTTTQGKYSAVMRRTTDYLISRARPNGLIGEPEDHQYTYGHGFSMLFLSQVLGEEEDEDRRETITDVLSKAVEFTGQAQTSAGGWGYVSAKDGSDFDEGSTTVTQVQGLRGCRNAGIPVPLEVIEKAIKYIHSCQLPDGGICYSSQNRTGSRPAITAAAVACLFNAGEYDGENVQQLLKFCKQNLYDNIENPRNTFGHWFYTYYYYSQAIYRIGGSEWEDLRDRLYARLLSQQSAAGSWSGEIGPVYCTALALTMLQLENDYLPIYQR